MKATYFCLLANEALDRKRLDQTAFQPDLKGPVRSTDQKHDPLTSKCLLDIVVLVIHVHDTFGANFAGKPPPMDGIQPTIRVDSFWQRRQGWQAREGDLWRPIATGCSLVRSLLVVMPEEALTTREAAFVMILVTC